MLVTQHKTLSEISHMHYMPTAFADENIIYKYLDTNIFALVAKKAKNEELVVYLINGVSGRVIYKYFEKKIRFDMPISAAISENVFILAFQRQSSNGLSQ